MSAEIKVIVETGVERSRISANFLSEAEALSTSNIVSRPTICDQTHPLDDRIMCAIDRANADPKKPIIWQIESAIGTGSGQNLVVKYKNLTQKTK